MHWEAYILPYYIIPLISQRHSSESNSRLSKGQGVENIQHVSFEFHLCVEYPIDRLMITSHKVFFRIVLNIY